MKRIEPNSFGYRLATVRKARGYGQDYTADNLGVTVTTLSKWENNKTEPCASELIKLCQLLDCSPAYLLGLKKAVQV